jgi:hypothetical protein
MVLPLSACVFIAFSFASFGLDFLSHTVVFFVESFCG